MKSAKDARRETESIDSNKAKLEVEKIEKAIQEAINNGKFNCYIDFYPSAPVKYQVTSLGYSIGPNYGRYNETCVEISW
jgi:hypothetical protein